MKLSWAYVYPGGRTEPDGPYYSFDVSNAGRRVVTITAYGFRSGELLLQFNAYNPAFPLLSGQELPHELTEGKNKTLFVKPDVAKQDIRERLKTPPKRAYVRDAIGGFYYCKVPTRMRDEIWGDVSYRPWWKPWQQGWWPF